MIAHVLLDLGERLRQVTHKREATAEHPALRVAAQEMLDTFALSKVGGQLGGHPPYHIPWGFWKEQADVGYAKVWTISKVLHA